MTGRDRHEAHDSLAALNLPHAVPAQALKLLGRIQQARTADELFRTGDCAEGFVLAWKRSRRSTRRAWKGCTWPLATPPRVVEFLEHRP